MNVNAKYLKDENGDVISPIVSTDTIFKNNTTLLDLFYPIGSYYETSNKEFNPNIAWGGTWIQDTLGYVTVGADTEGEGGMGTQNVVLLDVGETFGEKTHTLTTNEIPSHWHQIGGDYVVSRGTSGGWGVQFTNTTDWCAISVAPSEATEGGGQEHNNVQPSIGVIRWHRTA